MAMIELMGLLYYAWVESIRVVSDVFIALV